MSQHPVDVLIRDLIQSARSATAAEIEQIVERMASAPFEPRNMRVPVEHRGLSYLGRTLGARESALFYHLVKRLVVERQWARGTTEVHYLADLRHAVRDSLARLTIYRRRSGHLAATVTPTDRAVASIRRGPRSLPELVVIYSADRGIIVTGYQVSKREQAQIPEEALWLR